MKKRYGPTQHMRAHELRLHQLARHFIGYLGSKKSCDDFIPTPRHLHGGVLHTTYGRASVKGAEHGWI